MTERLPYVLKRIDSRHLAKLWSFYRDYFADDDSCLSFIYGALANEPAKDGTIYRELDRASGSFVNEPITAAKQNKILYKFAAILLFVIEKSAFSP